MKENETKFIEHYDYWICEKCGHISVEACRGICPNCKLTIIDIVPLDDGVVW